MSSSVTSGGTDTIQDMIDKKVNKLAKRYQSGKDLWNHFVLNLKSL